MINRIKGVVPIVLTPLKKNGDIDLDSCVSLIEYLLTNNASGLFILGSASEQFLLDTNQRIDTVIAMAEANQGRVPLIAGCSNIAPRNVFDFFKAVKDAQLDGFHFLPEDLKISDKQLIYQIKTYADAAPFPLYLYHNPKRGKAITTEVINALKSHPNIWGMKVGGYDRNEMKSFLELDSDEFQILGAGGGQFYLWLTLGADAITASSACCFPRIFSDLYNLFCLGNLNEAERKQKWWQIFHKSIPNTAPDNGEYAAEEKYILKKLGVIKYDYCHFPYRQLTDNEKHQIDDALKTYYISTNKQ